MGLAFVRGKGGSFTLQKDGHTLVIIRETTHEVVETGKGYSRRGMEHFNIRNGGRIPMPAPRERKPKTDPRITKAMDEFEEGMKKSEERTTFAQRLKKLLPGF